MELFNFMKKKETPSFVANSIRKTLHKNLNFTALEQYKLLRTNLEFVLPQEDGCPVIGITSSTRGEGKSTTAINLSYVLSEKGSSVLLIDGDLRLPSVAKKLEITQSFGLTDLLRGKTPKKEEFQTLLSENWYILTSGEIPPNPSELLGSRKMESVLSELRKMFDYIVVDLPPVNIVSDAVSISKLIDGMVLVMREEYTGKKELDSCIRQLELSNVKILGCVMTCSKRYGRAYSKYKRYKYYGRYGRYGHYGHYGKYGYYGHHEEDEYYGAYEEAQAQAAAEAQLQKKEQKS